MKTIFRTMLLLSAAFGSAQQTYTPWDGAPMVQFSDANGDPLAGGKLYTYVAGSTTPRATYQDTVGTVNTNPVILDSAGRAKVWLASGGYKFILKDSSDVVVQTVDNVILSTGTGFPCASMPAFTGDVANTQCAVTVIGLRGRTVANTAPNDLQYLGWNAAGSQWEPKTLASTSVALTAPSSIFSVSGSPGASLGLSFATGQAANQVYGTDGAGAAGLMSLTEAQLPWTKTGTTTVMASVASFGSGQVAKWDANNNLTAGGSLPVIQVITGQTSCTVASGASFNTCTASYSWPVAFADSSYAAVCSAGNPSDPRVNYQGINSQTSAAVTLQFVTDGSTGGTMSNVQCIGVHP